jgi:CheY-like chemotaxis protein
MHAAGDDNERPTNVRRLQPLRVLLSGRDRRFVRVTSFLLSRRGYDVTQATFGDIVEAAERHRADVVLLELSDSRMATARTIAALQASAASPGLLLLFDDGEKDRCNGLPAVHKWTPIEGLIEKIETAALRRIPPGVAALLAERESQSL